MYSSWVHGPSAERCYLEASCVKLKPGYDSRRARLGRVLNPRFVFHAHLASKPGHRNGFGFSDPDDACCRGSQKCQFSGCRAKASGLRGYGNYLGFLVQLLFFSLGVVFDAHGRIRKRKPTQNPKTQNLPNTL